MIKRLDRSRDERFGQSTMGLVVKMPTEANTAEEPSTMLKGVCQKMFISTVGRAELFQVGEMAVSRMLHRYR